MATVVQALPENSMKQLLIASGIGGVVINTDDIHAKLRAFMEDFGRTVTIPSSYPAVPVCNIDLPHELNCTLFPKEPFRLWMETLRKEKLSENDADYLQVLVQEAASKVIQASKVLRDARKWKNKRILKGSESALLLQDIEHVLKGLDVLGVKPARAAINELKDLKLYMPHKKPARAAKKSCSSLAMALCKSTSGCVWALPAGGKRKRCLSS